MIPTQTEEIAKLRAALTSITKPEGVFSRDRETYLKNVIAWCVKMAEEALGEGTEKGGE